MPNCRNCGARISKFDGDICPVCGTKDPLKGVSSETVEITSQIDLNGFKDGQKVVCRRKTLLLYFLIAGFTGLPFFYLKKKVLGLIYLLANLLVLAGLFFLFYFAISLHIVASIILPIVIIYLINGAIGMVFNFLPDLKDGEGEFVV